MPHTPGPVVLVRNATDHTIPRWSTLAVRIHVADVQIDRHQNTLIADGEMPTSNQRSWAPAILLESTRPGRVAPAVIDGVTLARVRRDGSHMRARFAVGEPVLVAAPSGPAELLHVPTTSEGIAIVRLGPRYDWFWGRITARQAIGIYRWAYEFVEVAHHNGSWTTVENGHSGLAYNALEVPNSSSGELGNGVSAQQTQVSPCFTSAPSFLEVILPIGIGAIVPICVHYFPGPGNVDRYWFAQTNTINNSDRVLTRLQRFVLLQSLQPGGTASATLLGWNPITGQYNCLLAETEVCDSLGCFSGVAGTPGWCTWMPDASKYEIVTLCC